MDEYIYLVAEQVPLMILHLLAGVLYRENTVTLMTPDNLSTAIH